MLPQLSVLENVVLPMLVGTGPDNHTERAKSLARRNITLFLVGHEVHNTGFYSLLPSMDQIYVTSGTKSKKIVKDLRRILELDEEQELDKFLLLPFHYLPIEPKAGSTLDIHSKSMYFFPL